MSPARGLVCDDGLERLRLALLRASLQGTHMWNTPQHMHTKLSLTLLLTRRGTQTAAHAYINTPAHPHDCSYHAASVAVATSSFPSSCGIFTAFAWAQMAGDDAETNNAETNDA